MTLKKGISLLIPVHGGREMLAEALESAELALIASGLPYEMIVINNNSPDDTSEWLKENMHQVLVLDMPDNNYLKNLNSGMRACNFRYLALLNNDMRVQEDYLKFILPHFDDPKVFAVTTHVQEWGTDKIQGHRRIYRFTKGWFFYLPAEDDDSRKFHGHATGGQSVFDLEKLLELGLNDLLLRPLYHEDLDITWRAYKRGYHARYEPRAIVHHRGGATSKKLYTPLQLESIKAKNLFLFMWKNLHEPKLILSHFIWLPFRLTQALFRKKWEIWIGFISALKQVFEIPKARNNAKQNVVRKDTEILDLLKN